MRDEGQAVGGEVFRNLEESEFGGRKAVETVHDAVTRNKYCDRIQGFHCLLVLLVITVLWIFVVLRILLIICVLCILVILWFTSHHEINARAVIIQWFRVYIQSGLFHFFELVLNAEQSIIKLAFVAFHFSQ